MSRPSFSYSFDPATRLVAHPLHPRKRTSVGCFSDLSFGPSADAQVFGCHHPNIATKRHATKIVIWIRRVLLRIPEARLVTARWPDANVWLVLRFVAGRPKVLQPYPLRLSFSLQRR